MKQEVALLSEDIKADIQGFITSGYNHLRFAYYVPVNIADKTRAKEWLKTIIPQITTSKSWRPIPNAPKQLPTRALNIAFMPEGLTQLGLSHDLLCTFAVPFQEGISNRQRSRKLGDYGKSDPKNWEIGATTSNTFHLLLILNADSQEAADSFLAKIRQSVEAYSDGVNIIDGLLQGGMRTKEGKEPFGFADGMGQPKIARIRREGAVATGEFILGYENGYNYLPMTPLVESKLDPANILKPYPNPNYPDYKDFGLNGSYLVYRKFEQDVFGFWDFLREQSKLDKGFVSGSYMVWLAAKMVGRWPSGAPLAKSPYQDDPTMLDKDKFFYADDPDGKKCPFGSHIRRNNPRDNIRPSDEISSLHISDRHRILRRAVRYGEMLFDLSILDDLNQYEKLPDLIDAGNKNVSRGIHFFAVNANIETQFEFLQQSWDNNPRFNDLIDNRDPIIGDNSLKYPSRMIIPQDPIRLRTKPMPRFVNVKGGAYLFMPSIRALNYLAAN